VTLVTLRLVTLVTPGVNEESAFLSYCKNSKTHLFIRDIIV